MTVGDFAIDSLSVRKISSYCPLPLGEGRGEGLATTAPLHDFSCLIRDLLVRWDHLPDRKVPGPSDEEASF